MKMIGHHSLSLRSFSSNAASTASPVLQSRLARLREQLAEVVTPTFSSFAGSSGSASAACAPSSSMDNSPAVDGSVLPKPEWLRIDTPTGERRANLDRLAKSVKSKNLATVCEEARCPNIGECWGGKEGTATATIMIMGDTCTRGCSFCNVKTSHTPPPLDPAEPKRVAEAVSSWGVNYVVITSVDRDELPDQGSGHFAATVRAMKAASSTLRIECLTPDFRGVRKPIEEVARSGLDVYAHNVETVERMQSRVRDHRAGYRQSLSVLEIAKAAVPTLLTKTSIMLGVGEKEEEVRATLRDLRSSGVDVVTFGQ